MPAKKKQSKGRKKVLNYSEVYRLYVEERKTGKEICGTLKVSAQTLYNFLHENGIERPRKMQDPTACTDQVKKKCIYGNTNGVPSCDYISVTGHKRPCNAEECTVYRNGKQKEEGE